MKKPFAGSRTVTYPRDFGRDPPPEYGAKASCRARCMMAGCWLWKNKSPMLWRSHSLKPPKKQQNLTPGIPNAATCSHICKFARYCNITLNHSSTDEYWWMVIPNRLPRLVPDPGARMSHALSLSKVHRTCHDFKLLLFGQCSSRYCMIWPMQCHDMITGQCGLWVWSVWSRSTKQQGLRGKLEAPLEKRWWSSQALRILQIFWAQTGLNRSSY